MAKHCIMSVLIKKRSKVSPIVQEVLTKYGCSIKMRLGLHEAGDVCSEEGLILLQLCGEETEQQKLSDELNSLEGVKSKTMCISFDE